MGAILIVRMGLPHQTHVYLIHQRGGLESVVRTLISQIGGCQLVQLPINNGKQFIERGLIAVFARPKSAVTSAPISLV
jgi:hypothetical protein